MRIIMAAQAGNTLSTIENVAKSLGSGGLLNSLGNLKFGFQNLSTAGTVGMDAIKQGSIGLTTTFLKIGSIAALVGAAIAVWIGDKAVHAAGDFQTSMLALESHAGLVASQVNTVTDALMQMGPAVGQGPTQLANALYPIMSGFSGITDQAAKTQVSLNELKLASMSVVGTTTDTTTVAKAATSAFNAYGLASNDTATNISRMNNLFDVMNQTVTEGNMKWSEYAVKVGDLAAKASQSGIKFTEANAALAVFTNTGESVQLAGTHLGALFQSMSLDVDKYVTRAKKLHESFDVTKFKSLDLAGKIKYLDEITGGDSGKIKAILGNKTLASTFLKLVDHTKDYQNALGDLNHSQGATQTAFDKASSGYQASMNRAKASIDVVLIKIGTDLLPVLGKLVDKVAPIIVKIGDWLVKSGLLKNALNFVIGTITNLVSWGSAIVSFFKNNEVAMDALKATLIVLAVIIGVAMVIALYSMATAAWAAMLPFLPIIAVILLIIVVVTVVILIIQHWGAIMDWLKGVASAVASAVGGFFSGLGTVVHNIVGGIGNAFSGLGTLVHGIWNGIVSGIKGAINIIIGAINWFIGFIDAIQIHIPSIGVGPVHTPSFDWNGLQIPKIPLLATGGIITRAGLVGMNEQGAEVVSLPTGAAVYPHGTVPAGAGGGITQIFNISISTMARSQAEVQRLVDMVEQELGRRVRQQTPGYNSSNVF